MTNLSKLANIANALTLEGLEIGCNTAVLQINDAGERLIEKGAK